MKTSPLFQVVLARVPGSSTMVNFTEPTTINDLVIADGGNPAEWKYQIGGQEVDGTTQVTEHTGKVILIKSKVKGN